MHRFLALVSRFGRDERGVFAVIFGLMAIVLVALGGAVVDYVSLEQTRSRAQIALDAAALALQSEITRTPLDQDAIEARAQDLLIDRIGDPSVVAEIERTVINVEEGSLFFEAQVVQPTLFVSLVGVPQLSARIHSEVRRGSMDVEVSVAIDLTGSMAQSIPRGDGTTQSKVAALEEALLEMIPLLVKDEQEPSYSKMAIVPYSMGVNVGSTYATTIRGAITGATAISGASWSTGTAKTISSATRANPVVITANAHGFNNGDHVFVYDVTGMTQIDRKVYVVANRNTNTFQLRNTNGTNVNGSGWNALTGGRVIKCQIALCEVTVTSTNHGLSTGETAFVTGVGGVTSINNTSVAAASGTGFGSVVWPVGATTANTYVLTGSTRANRNYEAYTSGGSSYCTRAGCQWYYFTNMDGNARRHQVSTCVTERTINPFNDQPPSTTLLGRNYPSTENVCLSNTIQPLTSNKTVLNTLASNLVASGSTGGHIGVGWGWYMVSPNFNGPWPAESQPAPADAANVLRAVVIMTDGEFNSVYCNGVISQASTNGSGENRYKINCNAPNQGSFAQAEALCAAMHAAEIRVYTVGFAIVNAQAARDLMANCASDPSYRYEANTGQALTDVFVEIARSVEALRLTL